MDINLDPALVSNILTSNSSEEIHFPPASFDGIIMECSLSLMADQKKVLSEINRVLKENGRLIITDMYARGEPARLSGALGLLNSMEEITSLLEKQNFVIEHFEDYTKSLQTMWGQMIMDKGSDTFYNSVGANREELKRIKCGYYMIVAGKKGETA
jgi:ubiquinone/menaquinone biosynthesis C-methylase UbiE